MPHDARIIGAARSDMDDAGYRAMIADAIAEFGGREAKETKALKPFSSGCTMWPSTPPARAAGQGWPN